MNDLQGLHSEAFSGVPPLRVVGGGTVHVAILNAFAREKITFEDFLCSCLVTLTHSLISYNVPVKSLLLCTFYNEETGVHGV